MASSSPVETSTSWPRIVRAEVGRIRRVRAVSEPIAYEIQSGGKVRVSFLLKTDLPLEQGEWPIRDVEPIIFEYESADAVGRIGPTVLSGRDDFPRDLTHLNPVPPGSPASLCVARAGVQSIYDVQGVEGVVLRTLSWLNDAKVDALNQDGWEPVPPVAEADCILGYLDPLTLQEHAASHPEGGCAYFCVGLEQLRRGRHRLHVHGPVIDTANEEHRQWAVQRMDQKPPQSVVVPGVFCWAPRERVEASPKFTSWRNVDTFKQGLAEVALFDQVEQAVWALHPLFGAGCDLDFSEKRAILVVIGLWRPEPLQQSIYGLSDSKDARCLELRAFYLERDRLATNLAKQFWQPSTLRDVYVLSRPTADLLATVSGEPPLPTLAILGGGALGSAFYDYAVRGGSTDLSVFDKDLLHTHNLARHRADLRHLHVLKEHALHGLARTRHIDMPDQSVQSDGTDLSRISLANFADLLKGKSCVIDATADPVVRRRLSRVRGLSACVVRAEIFNRGRLGVCLATTLKHAQNLNCLYYQLIALADGDQRVREWLKYESSAEFMEEELVLGFGCASKTTRMPMYKVDAHAAASYAFIRSRATSDVPAIALHEIDANGLSKGVSCVEPAPVQVFGTTATTGEWTVLVAEPVVAKVRELRRKATPNETGGYLFGAIDEDAREVYVMAASAEPPGSHGTPNGLMLGRWGQTPFEKRFLRRTQRRLPPIGTWHSHPTDDAEASAKDRHTLNGFREQDARYGFPTIMGIVGGVTEKFYVYDDEPPAEQAARSQGQSQ